MQGMIRNIKKMQSRRHVSGSCLIRDGPTKVVSGTHRRPTKIEPAVLITLYLASARKHSICIVLLNFLDAMLKQIEHLP